MPVKLIQEAEETEVEVTTVDEATNPFVNEDGDPTLEARAISDFLTHADFGSIFEHPEAVAQILTVGEAAKVTAYAASLTEMPKNGHKGKGMFKKKNGKNGKDDDDYDDDDDNGNGKDENVSNSVKAGASSGGRGKEMHDGDGPVGKNPTTGKTSAQGGNKAESVDFEESTLYPEFATALAEAGGAMHHCNAHEGMKKGKMKKVPYAEAALADVAERGSGDIYSKSGVKKGATKEAQAGNDDAGKGHRPMQSGAKVESLVQFLDGALAAQLIDETDLVAMFAHYCDGLAEAVEESDTPLTAKAQLALLSEMFGIESGKSFKKSKTTEDVAKLLVAMLSESVVKHVPEGKAGKRLTAAMRESNLSSFKAAARRAVRGESADADLSLEEVPVFGIASPVGEAAFEVGANAKAKLAIEPAPEQTDEETDDDETAEPGKKKVAEAVRVVNHAGSGRTGPQLAEAVIAAGSTKKKETPAGSKQSSTVTESEAPKKPAAASKRSSGASLAAGMVKAQTPTR